MKSYSMYILNTVWLEQIALIMPAMAVTKAVSPSPARADGSPSTHAAPRIPSCTDDAMLCERCGQAEMYRMHAVWRCPACGFKTDCCGW